MPMTATTPVIPTSIRNEAFIALALPGSVDVHFATHVLVPPAEVGVGAGLREDEARRRPLVAEREVERAIGSAGQTGSDRVLDLVLVRPRDPRIGGDSDVAGAELEALDGHPVRCVGGGRRRHSDGPPDDQTLHPHHVPPAPCYGSGGDLDCRGSPRGA